jgi:chemotaxis methyl-accepting protein methylase
VLEQIVFPSLLLKLLKSERKEIRIWTAACASGQETYSLVMILEELRKTYHEKFSYRIIATDQSQTRIEDAKRGQFSPETLQNVQMKRLNRWFKKNGDIYTVNNVLKENIDFSVFDLFDNKTISPPTSIFGDFDLIVCANLLFYYKQEFRKKIIQKTENCLSKGGYLVTSETERDILMKNNYQEVFQQSAIFQKYR